MVIYDKNNNVILDIPVDDDSYRDDIDMTPLSGAGK